VSPGGESRSVDSSWAHFSAAGASAGGKTKGDGCASVALTEQNPARARTFPALDGSCSDGQSPDDTGPARRAGPCASCSVLALGLRDQLDLLPERAGAAHVQLGLLDLRTRDERGDAAAAFALLVLVVEGAGAVVVVAVVVVPGALRPVLEVVAVRAALDLGVFGHFARDGGAVGRRDLQHAAFERCDGRDLFARGRSRAGRGGARGLRVTHEHDRVRVVAAVVPVAASVVRRRRRGKGERQKRACERWGQDPSHLAFLLVPPSNGRHW